MKQIRPHIQLSSLTELSQMEADWFREWIKDRKLEQDEWCWKRTQMFYLVLHNNLIHRLSLQYYSHMKNSYTMRREEEKWLTSLHTFNKAFSQ
jgi:hypothetical protein